MPYSNNTNKNIKKATAKKHRRTKAVYFILPFMLIFGACAAYYSGTAASNETRSSASEPQVSSEAQISSSDSGITNSGSENETASPEGSSGEPGHSVSSEITSGYDFSKPVPRSAAVDKSYFDDAVFIGDSRTEGLITYNSLNNATSLTYKGLMVDTAFTKPVINVNGKLCSVMDALAETKFSKVYIMLGINETGWAYSNIFIEKYEKIIDRIREINPAATIYIQQILPVSQSVSSTHKYITNKKINEYNSLLQKSAEKKQVYYIDTANAVTVDGGPLPEDAAFDGIHLKKAYCVKWFEYLKTHHV